MPKILARLGVDRDQARSIQIVAGTIAAKRIARRRPERQIRNPPLRIHRDQTPDVHAGTLLRAISQPATIVRLARLWDGVKRPRQLTGVNVESAHIARR